jgi:hypothetical protein
MTGYAVRIDGQGWRAVDCEFADPDDPLKIYPDPKTETYSEALPPAPIPCAAEVSATALANRDVLLGKASLRISPLQDAVDLDTASATDIVLLKAWKQYRVAVNRITEQPGYPDSIEWPEEPTTPTT